MGTIYGYARISRAQQSIERQIRNILKFASDAKIYQEAFTGRRLDRPEWQKLYKRLSPGDTVIFDSVSRMSRNADDGCELYEELFNKDINLIFLKEQYINTDVYREAIKKKINIAIKSGDPDIDKMMQSFIDSLNEYIMSLAKKQVRLAFEQSEKEVEDLRQRTREGIQTAKLKGKKPGRVPGREVIVKKKAPIKEQMQKHCKDFGGSLSDVDCMKLVGISKNTFYKYKKELKQEMGIAC